MTRRLRYFKYRCRVNLFLNPGNYIISRTVDLILVWSGFHLSLLGLLYLLVNTFRNYLNRTGRIANALSQYSYGVYIIHFVVMGGLALILLNTTIPSNAKYAILALSTFAASNLAMFFYKETLQRLRNSSLSLNSKFGPVVS